MEVGEGSLGGHLDDLHGEDEVLVRNIIDRHVARALGVVHECTLGEGHLDRGLVDILLAQLLEVHHVRVFNLHALAFDKAFLSTQA